jgi:hypothetical protein
MRRRSLPHLFFIPALVFGLSSIASKCSDDPLSLGYDKGGSGGSDSDGGGGAANAGAGGAGGGSDACPRSACGPQLGIANYQCSDGTTGGPTGRCLPRENGTCGWEIHQCPPAAADAGSAEVCPTSACGPQLGLPNHTCTDGSIAGPTGRCLPRGNGVCGWEIRECPTSGGTGTSDGGKVTHVDGGTTDPCSAIEDTIRALITDHQSCTTNADCHTVALYCLPGSRCTGTQYVNQAIDQSAFTTPQHQLNQCMTGDPNQIGCAQCFIADPEPACLNGTCGPAPLCDNGSRCPNRPACPSGMYNPVDASGCTDFCSCVAISPNCDAKPPCGSQCPPGTHPPIDAKGCVVSCTCVQN